MTQNNTLRTSYDANREHNLLRRVLRVQGPGTGQHRGRRCFCRGASRSTCVLRGRGIRGEGLEKNKKWEVGQKQEAFREWGQAVVFRFLGGNMRTFFVSFFGVVLGTTSQGVKTRNMTF